MSDVQSPSPKSESRLTLTRDFADTGHLESKQSSKLTAIAVVEGRLTGQSGGA
jgi:hypothetical protein